MLQVLLVVVVYVLGPALVLTWAVKRFRSGVKPDFTEIVAVSLAVVLIGLLIFSYSNMVTDSDSGDVDKIITAMTSRYEFPLKAKYAERPAVDGIPHARYLEIRIYGVTTPQEQEKVIAIAQKLRREVASKSLVINFFEAEVWEERPDGSRLPLREQEHLLRKFRIE